MKNIQVYCWLSVFVFIVTTQLTEAQGYYEPVHGVTGYDYDIKGELELKFTNSIDLKNGNQQKGTYNIKSPVLLSFNLNDLKFFKANPKEFIGYVENPVIASCGGPCSGGLIDISQGDFREKENWMQADVHFIALEDGISSEVNAAGEIYPFMEVSFSIPDFSKEIKVGLNQLQFRLFVKGISDSQYHPVRNVTTQLPISITCGTFFGSDMVDALMKRNLLEADAAKKKEFEDQFEKVYFKDLPRIDAIKLIDFLIKPVGNYETPIVGSFSSDSESGSERATYEGTLRLLGNQIRKSE